MKRKERERGMTYVFTIRIECLFRRILGLGLIRETLINTVLELAYYIRRL